MPTPRRHGGAALTHIPLTVPGFLGLNTQAASSILGPEWATTLLNSTLDENNRVAARKGWVSQTSTAISGDPQIVQLVEYRQHAGTNLLVCTADDDKIYVSDDNGATWTDRTGTVTVATNRIHFQNFRDKLLGFQDGGNPIVYTGTGDFTEITDGGSQPTGGIGLGAFGRVWAVNSTGYEIQYSGLLDETDWSSSDSGTLSLENVWPETDTIQALAAFNGVLVAFGRENIVMWTDGRGSAIGLDPLQAYVVDTISGVGCIARDSIQQVRGDLWFLSKDGLQSLGRLVQEKSNPLLNLSKNIQDFLLEAVNDPELTLENVRSVYSPEDRFYLLSLPRTRTDGSGNDTETGRAFAFDTRQLLQDGSARVVGMWTGLVPRAVCKRRNNDVFMALTDVPAEVGKYTGYQDNDGSYQFTYESGWLDLTQQGYLILPKRIDGTFYLGSDNTVSLKWAFDFDTQFKSRGVQFIGVGSFSEWGDGEWGIAEWGGGTALKEAKVAASGTGEFIKLGTNVTINGGAFSIQQIDLFAKIGRLK